MSVREVLKLVEVLGLAEGTEEAAFFSFGWRFNAEIGTGLA